MTDETRQSPAETVSHAKKAANALSDLHVFSAVIALMESSLVSSDCHTAEGRIVSICKLEAQKCLRQYDKALEQQIKSHRPDGAAS